MRYKRAQERAAKHRTVNEDDGSCFDVENEADGCCVVAVLKKEKSVQTQTDLTQFDMAHSEMELSLSRSQLDVMTLTFESLQGNDVKILYYTGISNWEIFLVVFGYVWSDLPEKCRLSQFQQLLMTLMRLTHNFPLQDLGYCFSVHMRTISRVFNHVIDILYVKLKPLILWPECDVFAQNNANVLS